MIYVSRITCMLLAGCMLAAVPVRIHGAYGSSGWGIFRKLTAVQPKAVAVTTTQKASLYGFMYNPAILESIPGKRASFQSELGAIDEKLGGVLYKGIAGDLNFGVGFIYSDLGKAELNWIENGVLRTKTVTAESDIMGIAGISQIVSDQFVFGINGKFGYSTIAEMESATAYATDVSMLCLLTQHVTLTAAVQNIGISTKFLNKENKLPRATMIGAGYHLQRQNIYGNLGLIATHLVEEDKIVPEVGLEVGMHNAALHVGYRSNVEESTVQAGFKVGIKSIEIGYAYLPGNTLDAVQRLSVDYTFMTSLGGGQPVATRFTKRKEQLRHQRQRKKSYRKMVRDVERERDLLSVQRSIDDDKLHAIDKQREIAQLYASQGNYEEALTHISGVYMDYHAMRLKPQISESIAAIEKDEKKSSAKRKKKSKTEEVNNYKRGLEHQLKGNLKSAVTYFEKYVTSKKTAYAAQARASAAEAYLQLGMQYYKEGKYISASRAWRRGNRLNPKNETNQQHFNEFIVPYCDEHFFKGLSAYSNNDLQNAEKYWESVLKIYPEHEKSKKALFRIKK